MEVAFNNHNSDLDYNRKTAKKLKRGCGKNKNLSVYLNNVNGLSARADSVANILQTLKPDIVVFCETKASNAFAANFLKNQCYEPVVKKRLSPNFFFFVIQ